MKNIEINSKLSKRRSTFGIKFKISPDETLENYQNITSTFAKKLLRSHTSKFDLDNVGTNLHKKKQLEKKQKMRRFWYQIIICAQHLQNMNLSPEEWLAKNVFPPKPYFRPKSRELIEYAKVGDVFNMNFLLSLNKYLVYDYDNCHQTALHWAAKRDHTEAIKLLVKYGWFIDWKDIGICYEYC